MRRIILGTVVVISAAVLFGCGFDDATGVPWPLGREYAVGDTGPAGGVVFYDSGGRDNGWRYLEAARNDQSASIAWSPLGTVSGVTNPAIGAGETNTADIITFYGAGTYAATLCEDLVLGGYDDWFLPSQDELFRMYENQTLIGGFDAVPYWTSTESSDIDAYTVFFNDGSQSPLQKTVPNPVRAIRAF